MKSKLEGANAAFEEGSRGKGLKLKEGALLCLRSFTNLGLERGREAEEVLLKVIGAFVFVFAFAFGFEKPLLSSLVALDCSVSICCRI